MVIPLSLPCPRLKPLWAGRLQFKPVKHCSLIINYSTTKLPAHHNPTVLPTCFLKNPFPFCAGRGAPWMERGSLIRAGSSLAGILVMIA